MPEHPDTRPSLLLRLRDPDDQAAWDTFLEVYQPLVLGFCRRRGLQDADARDVAQDVMRAVSQAIHKLDYDPQRGTFRAWLFRVTRSKLADHFKARGRQPRGSGRTTVHQAIEQQPGDDAWAQEWDRESERRLFAWACGRIEPTVEPNTWKAFWMNAVEARPASEVARAVGLSVGAVYVAKSRTLARVRRLIDELGEADPFAKGNPLGPAP